jgi:carbonic anhydrase/acetyltransferase-like protein (isoleucine patch superfamily)
MEVPPGSLVAGVPAKVKRELSAEERQGVTLNGTLYADLAKAHGKVYE